MICQKFPNLAEVWERPLYSCKVLLFEVIDIVGACLEFPVRNVERLFPGLNECLKKQREHDRLQGLKE